MFASELPLQFVKQCATTRQNGVEHLAFLCGTRDAEMTSGRHLHVNVTHLLFPKQKVMAQTVEAELASLQALLDRMLSVNCEKWWSVRLCFVLSARLTAACNLLLSFLLL